MSWFGVMRQRRFWMGLAASVVTVLLLCAVGALLQEKGVAGADAGEFLVCLAFACGGWLGTHIACRHQTGTLARGIMIAVWMTLLVILCSLTLGGGPRLSETWKQLACLYAACIAGATLGARNRAGRRKPSGKRPAIPRHIRQKVK